MAWRYEYSARPIITKASTPIKHVQLLPIVMLRRGRLSSALVQLLLHRKIAGVAETPAPQRRIPAKRCADCCRAGGATTQPVGSAHALFLRLQTRGIAIMSRCIGLLDRTCAMLLFSDSRAVFQKP